MEEHCPSYLLTIWKIEAEERRGRQRVQSTQRRPNTAAQMSTFLSSIDLYLVLNKIKDERSNGKIWESDYIWTPRLTLAVCKAEVKEMAAD